MTLPGQSITRRDGGLGLAGDASNVFLYVITSSAGTVNTIERFSNPTRLRAALGSGEGVEGACWRLDHVGGSVDVLKVAGSVAAVNGSITKSSTGPVITIAGTALIPATATIEIMLAGDLGAGRFSYTLDGETWSEILTIPAGGTYLIPGTGITVTFPAGSYVLGETYAFTLTPATFNATDLTAAWDAALNSDEEWPAVIFGGFPASASAAATLAAAEATLMAQLEARYKYGRSVVSCGNDTEANVDTAFATVQSNYLACVHGTIQYWVGTKIPGWSWPRLPYTYEFARRAALVAPATNPGWCGLPDDVAVTLIKNPSFDEFKEGETLHDRKINTMRTYPRKRGTYPTNALLKSAAGSDYRYWQWGRVIDIASSSIQLKQQAFINRSVRTITTGTPEQIGCLDPRDANDMRKEVVAELDEQLLKKTTSEGIKGYCSGYSYSIDLTNKILTTRELRSSSRIGPLANIEQITTDLGFAQEIA